MALRDWIPVPDSWIDPPNGLTAAEERAYNERYDATVKHLRSQGPEGKRRAQEFINRENEKYQAWRKAAIARRRREGR